MVPVDRIPPHKQGLDNGTLWLLLKPGSMNQNSDVRIQMLIFIHSENGCMQGSFLKRMHARVFLGTDVRNQKGHSDGCTQRTFGQRVRARYGANPGCAQPESRMHATPLALLLLLVTVNYYPCLRVYVIQINVDLSSWFFEFLPEDQLITKSIIFCNCSMSSLSGAAHTFCVFR